MLTFSTDELPGKSRFDHWVEVRNKQLFGATIELEKAKRLDFEGRFSAVAVGGATLAELSASTYRVSRTKGDIERLSSDSLCIAEQVRGPGWLDIGRDRTHFVRNATLVVSHSDMPFAAIPTRTDGFHFRTLKIPLKGRDVLARGAAGLEHQPLPHGKRLTQFLAAGFAALVEQGPRIVAPDTAIMNLGQLALLARGRVAPGSPESRAALRFGQYHAARQVILQKLFHPDLSPALVAGLLGVSVRQIHLLFEPTGESFSRTVASLRLGQARRQLSADRKRPVADVAFSCGFDSLATFYRLFRRAFGVSPGDIRGAGTDLPII